MTTLAVGLVGAAVGGIVGAPGLGFTVGAALGQAFLGGKSGQHTTTHREGSRLSDLKVQTSHVGTMIPVVYGTYRIAGNIIWATDIIERSSTATQTQHLGGGGKGGHHHHHHDTVITQTTTTYTYFANFALGLCQGTILGIRRIWADGTLIYNTSSTATTPTIMGSLLRAKQIRLYTGTDDQLPDPLIEAHVGAGSVPAFRGLAYLVFEDFALAEFANRLPNITVEVVHVGEHMRNLSQPVTCIETPLTDAVGQFSGFDGGVIHTKVGGEGWAIGPERVDLDLNLNVIQRFRGANQQPGVIYRPAIKAMPNLFFAMGGSASFRWYDAVTGQYVPLGWAVMSHFQTGVYANGHAYCFFRGIRGYVPSSLVHYQFNSAFELPQAIIKRINDVEKTFGQVNAVVFDMDMKHGYLFVTTLGTDGIPYLLAYDPLQETLIKRWPLTFEPLVADPLSRCYTVALNNDSTKVLLTRREGNISRAFLADVDLQADTLFVDTTETYLFEGIGNVVFLSDEIVYVGGLSSTLTTTKASVRGVHALEPSPLLLSDLIENLCQKAGLPLEVIDLSALRAGAQEIIGFALSQATSLRDALLPLQQAYHFDIVESGFTLCFIPRGKKADPMTIDADAGLAQEYGQTQSKSFSCIETRVQTLDLPQGMHVLFTNKTMDYQQGHQFAQRMTTKTASPRQSSQTQTIELPMVLTDNQAANIAEVLLYEAWSQRTQFAFTLSRQYAHLDPADVVWVKDQLLRLTSIAYGDPGLVNIKAVVENPSLYAAPLINRPDRSVLNNKTKNADVPLPSPTPLFLLDIPILQDKDDDTGFYACVSRLLPAWPGAIIAQSTDNGQTFAELYSQNTAATYGVTVTTLPESTTTVFDEDSILSIKLTTGELASVTERDLLNGANVALIGQEIVQFQNAILQSDGSYRLSRFLRGRRGTEWAVKTHQITELFIVIDAATWHRVKSPAAEIGLSRSYKAITTGRTVSASATTTFTNTARGKKPLSPAKVQGTRHSTGDLTLTWLPRTRVGGAWRDFVDALYDPEINGYEMDIMKEGAVIRTLSVPTESALYTAEQQITDFGTASPQNHITLKLYAIGRTVGRGFPTEAIL
jgi:hypothetical protein